ncbi:type II toxin-antitoxin system HicB family antitoxin [Veillonella tobetsuensis]|jgi:toxin-antitoxin system, antitoxin component, hicB family|uniref:HicB family protein n=1 Tax=Veillonella tobetsuensis TaxID=1110546 RepID=A0A2S7ZQR7_9FIRM|nr:type II toxin-antitoxin system HicB family antitoxin [Veillonella tobetsuensis]PQL25477.1 HicB family protein [Veillonella tobetsuensis]GCL68443.1 HicB family protein [Veillonella tobetsuensis]
MKFIYPAIIHDDSDGFWAEFPDLEYTSSTGATLTELITNAQEAMELYILGALEDGQSLPTPTSVRNLPCTDSSYPTLVQTDIDLGKNSKSIKKTLTIPAWLNERALEKGVNFSQLLQEALVEKTL